MDVHLVALSFLLKHRQRSWSVVKMFLSFICFVVLLKYTKYYSQLISGFHKTSQKKCRNILTGHPPGGWFSKNQNVRKEGVYTYLNGTTVTNHKGDHMFYNFIYETNYNIGLSYIKIHRHKRYSSSWTVRLERRSDKRKYQTWYLFLTVPGTIAHWVCHSTVGLTFCLSADRGER